MTETSLATKVDFNSFGGYNFYLKRFPNRMVTAENGVVKMNENSGFLGSVIIFDKAPAE